MTTIDLTSAPVVTAEHPDTVCIEVPHDPSALPRARACVLEAAARWGVEEADELRIVASELITNAVLHARSAASVCMRHEGRAAVTIEVADRGPGQPTPGHSGDGASLGLGLEIVAALAEDWGVRPTDDGKVVWARLAAAAA